MAKFNFLIIFSDFIVLARTFKINLTQIKSLIVVVGQGLTRPAVARFSDLRHIFEPVLGLVGKLFYTWASGLYQ